MANVGRTLFPDENSDFEIPVVEVSTNIPFTAMIEILAHELAHVIAGIESGHGEKWDAIFEAIHRKYNELEEKEMIKYGKEVAAGS